MSDNKLDQEHFSETNREQEHPEGYTFLEETIRPRKKTKLKKLIFTTTLGITFGIVTCFTFCAFYPVFSNMFNLNEEKSPSKDDKPDTPSTVLPIKTLSPTKSPVSTVTPEPTVAPTKSPDSGPKNEDDSNNLVSQIQKVQKIAAHALVTVNGVKTGKDILGNPNEESNYTSGIIVYKDSSKILVMTNSDVIDGASYITVMISDNTIYKCELYGINRQIGIALVKLSADQVDSRIYDTLVATEFGDSAVAQVGELVIALGNPNGYMDSVDYGVISNKQQDAYIIDGKVQLINTTIPQNSNGYGYIFDKKGRVIGVITHKENFVRKLNVGINTCLSMSSIRPFLQRMIDRKDNLYLGLVCNDISSDVAAKLDVYQGVYITKVEEKSPAFQAGIKKGDILLEINNVEITSMTVYYNKLNEYSDKTSIRLKIMRKQDNQWMAMEVGAILSKYN